MEAAGSPYTLGARLARGGMAEVYLGVHRGLAGFEKLVVVKRILPHLAEEGQFVQMLLDEARLAATLRHPGIVAITDLRRDEETFFLVMEYLRGESLGYLMARQRKGKPALSPIMAAYVVSTVADALHYAHTATDTSGQPYRLVHRDVTPSNVILTYTGQPKLIDFGIAKAAAHMTYTQPGTIKGKYAYSSPEQVSNRGLDARSDVFSLGVVLHEMLTGRRLFKADSPASTIRALTSGPIPLPSDVADVPPIFDEIVLRALQRDKEQRTPSAKALRDELNQALRTMGETVRREDLAHWMRRHLSNELEKRKAIEEDSLRRARGEAARTSVPGTLETPSVSGSRPRPSSHSHSQSSRPTPSHRTAPTVVAPRRPVGRWVLMGAIAIAITAAAFWAGRALQSPSSLPPTMESR